MGPDAAEPAPQSKQHNNKWNYAVEGEHRQKTGRGGRVRDMLRHCEPNWTAAEEKLQDLQEEIP